MAAAPLEANLEALARLDLAPVGQTIADVSADGELEVAGGAVTGVSVRTPSGLVRLHGRRDQVLEAGRLIPPAAAGAPLVAVMGAGAGFVLDALEQQAFAGRVLLLEPSPASLKAMLARRSWAAWLDAGRLRLLAGPDYAGWLDLWGWVGETSETPPLVVHPVLARERPAAVRQAVDVLERLRFNANANATARRRFAGPYLRNTLSNLPHLVASRDVAELFGRFPGVPAYVLGAGPSLTRNLEELRPHRDGALVLAVDTALRPCLAAGIEPDVVVAVDPGEANLPHLAVGATPVRTHLVAEPSVAPGSFDAFGGRVFTFRVARHDPWPWLLEQGLDRATLLAWGSVLSTTLDLAVKLGCGPVVLLGADFAYTGGQPYCRGTVFEEDWAREVAAGTRLEDVWRRWRREPVVTERGIDGREVETSAHLQAFRDWVVAFSRRQDGVAVVNGTGAGILHGLPRVAVDTVGVSHRRRSPGVSPAVAEGARARAAEETPRLFAHLSRQFAVAAAAALPAPWGQWLQASGGTVALGDLVAAVGRAHTDPDAAARWHEGIAAWARTLGECAGSAVAAHQVPVDAPCIETLGLPGDGAVFRTHRYQQFNARRLEHLASLGLPVAGRRVLEVGAGLGDLTGYFVDRGARVTTSDGRADNVARLEERFAGLPRVTVVHLDLDPPPATAQPHDVVFCYGTLYHVADPDRALEFLAACATELLLLETLVASNEDEVTWVPGPPGGGTPKDSVSGRTSRPGRRWCFERLRRAFEFVYVPVAQPNHYEFPTDWTDERGCVRRAIFVASRRPLASPALIDRLPVRQCRQG